MTTAQPLISSRNFRGEEIQRRLSMLDKMARDAEQGLADLRLSAAEGRRYSVASMHPDRMLQTVRDMIRVRCENLDDTLKTIEHERRVARIELLVLLGN